MGKTYLVDETFAGRITVRHAGLSPADENARGLLKLQLEHFYNSLVLHGMEETEGFWNTWGCHRKNLMVIVCGSANSWIQDKLINNHGGLYNRVTREMKLSPFTLIECEEFYESSHVRLSRYDIVQSYMIFGGIPYYMGYVNGEWSLESGPKYRPSFFCEECGAAGRI